MAWDLPTSVNVGGKMYEVNADFRDILGVIKRLNSPNLSERERSYVALALFYSDFDSIPKGLWNVAAEQLTLFLNCGVTETDKRPRPQLIDWEQDQQMIVADVNKVAACEIRTLPFLHWWTFVAYFNGIGEGQLSTVVSIRDKKRRGKPLDKWEREWYRDNKSRVDLKTKYSDEEQAEIDRLNRLLG